MQFRHIYFEKNLGFNISPWRLTQLQVELTPRLVFQFVLIYCDRVFVRMFVQLNNHLGLEVPLSRAWLPWCTRAVLVGIIHDGIRNVLPLHRSIAFAICALGCTLCAVALASMMFAGGHVLSADDALKHFQRSKGLIERHFVATFVHTTE